MPAPTTLTRRQLVERAALAAAGSAVFARALAASAGEHPVTTEMIRQAEWITGLELDDAERELMVEDVHELVGQLEALRAVELDNGVAPAVRFASAAVGDEHLARRDTDVAAPAVKATRPDDDDDLAFAGIAELAHLLATRQVSSVELTRLALGRLERFDPLLECVITPTRERALATAEKSDRERAGGQASGPLHGIPWGAKDLFAVPGFPTTWGAAAYREQVRPETAAVVERLDAAGAVLVAKLTLGALARGDVWFGGRTNNPWNPGEGSSGSSAGSAASTSAGLVPFALGTETLGSIISPCSRCGVTGLRPTFGRVSRYGAMTLAWTMDKVGAIARSAEDCALVFGAIHGADGRDLSAVDRPFHWPDRFDPSTVRLGIVESAFVEDRFDDDADEEARAAARVWQENDRQVLEVLTGMGFQLVPFTLPDQWPLDALRSILYAEAAAAFDDLTRSGRDAELTRQDRYGWPNTFRRAQLIPAVEYLRANRIRTLLMAEMERRLEGLDGYLCPSFGGGNLVLTNLTGHPQVVVPNGFRPDGTPTSFTFTGRLFGEPRLLAVAHAYQQATKFHRRRPPVERFLSEMQEREQAGHSQL